MDDKRRDESRRGKPWACATRLPLFQTGRNLSVTACIFQSGLYSAETGVNMILREGDPIMEEQSYARHTKIVPPYHRLLVPLMLLVFLGSVVNLTQSFGDHSRLYNASLITALSAALIGVALFARLFPLRAQDRAIRAEENLRHFAMTGKLLDPRLEMKQILALRFASDAEFTALAREAAEQGLSPDGIKQAIKNWRADHHRL